MWAIVIQASAESIDFSKSFANLRHRLYGVNGVAIGRMRMPDTKEIMARGEYGEVVLGATHDLIQRAIRSCR